MTAGCPHTPSVELLEDGRLPREQADALGLHLVSCESCTLERSRLVRLRAALRALPEPETTSFRVAAGRQRLLSTAGQRTKARSRRRWFAVVAFGLTAAAAGAAVKLGVLDARTPSMVARAAPPGVPELDVRITPSSGADWSRARTGAEETVTLRDGELRFEVVRQGSARLIVTLPDGELEDEGTVFRVHVAAGSTRTVSVTAGRVVLRLRGAEPRHLAAGESFEAGDGEKSGRAASSALADTSQTEAPSDRNHAEHEERAARAATATSSQKSARDSSPPHEPECPGAPRFEDCVGSFKRGEYAAAAAQLAEYGRLCGRHAEDASYLEMVALARAGRANEAKAQAKAYLARFPNGFRRKEAAELAATK